MTTLINYNLVKETGVFFDKEKKVFRKFFLSSNKNNIKKLNNEYIGYIHYFNQLKKKNLKKFKLIKKLNFLETEIIYGKKLKFWERITLINKLEKIKIIEKVIEHYKVVWPKKSSKKTFYHGDLTLDNIIFLEKEDILFIDWENFKKKEEWGLDIAYFLISLIVLPALNNNRLYINNLNLELFKNFWTKFYKGKNFVYLKDPINYIKNKNNNKNNFFYKIPNKMKDKIYESIL